MFWDARQRSRFQSACPSRMHILGHRGETTLGARQPVAASQPGPARLSRSFRFPPSDPSLPRENPFSPSRPLPWERRTGRTWSTRAKLSAKLRKIVSDTSSDPPLTLFFLPVVPPPSRQQWYGQADRRASGVKGGRTPGEWTRGGRGGERNSANLY